MNKNNKQYHFFYLVANIPINEELKSFIGIFEQNSYEVHPFTEYLTDRCGEFSLKNKSLNTIKNFHLTYIIRFLNYIYNDCENPINNIENLTLNLVEEFLDKFSQGTLPKDKNRKWKTRESVNRATYAISNFIYWLYWKKEKNSYKKKFKMKYFTEENFQFCIINKYSKNGYSSREVKKLINIVLPTMSSRSVEREKVVALGTYSVQKLIELSLEHDPMLTFGIVLGAYMGLRVGTITQLHEGRIKGLYNNKPFGAYFDFTYDAILRSDNVITGNIKTKMNIPIYPGCNKAIYNYYQIHLDYLKVKGLYPNKFGAIFIDNKGNAMTTQTYLKRFNKLNDLLDIVIKKEATLGNRQAIIEEQILSDNKVTPHSLRHYFKQLIESVESNPRIIQYYMAHKHILSQNSYAFANSTKENIRKVEDEIYLPIKNNFKNLTTIIGD